MRLELQNDWWITGNISLKSNKNSSFTIIMPEARVQLGPQAEHLHVSIEASEEKLSHLEHVVLDHLIRMGQTPLTATWTQV